MQNAASPSRPLRVLIVDDELNIRRLFAAYVSSLGHSAATASSASHALAVCASVPVDLVLVDIRMAGRDGLWLIERLRSEFPDVPIAIITGAGDLSPLVTLQPGIVGYAVKPIQRDDLRSLIERAVMGSGPWSGAGSRAIHSRALDAIEAL